MFDFDKALVDIRPRLRKFAYGLTRNNADADDLAQSALLRGLQYRESFRWEGEKSFPAFMFRIVRNAYFDDLRRHKVRGNTSPIEDCGLSTAPTQELTVSAKELLRFVCALPEKSVILQTAIGYELTAIAAASSVPIGTVRSKVSRARAKLRKEIGYENFV